MYRVFQQLGIDDPDEVFIDESPKLALAVCLRLPEEYEFLDAAFPGNPPELVALDATSLDYLVVEIEKGRLFHATFRRPGATPVLYDIHQSISKE